MNFLTQVNKKEIKLKLQEDFKVLILKRADMLAWYAKQLIKIFDDENFKISAATVTTSLILR